MPPLMESGKIDSLAFIGSSTAADRLIKAHPYPHRLKIFLQLEGKNMGIYMRDLFEKGGTSTNDDDNDKDDDGRAQQRMERIMKETIAGTLSYNGQRCTALKLLFVPKEYSTPYAGRVDYMKELINDAVEKGARIVNKNGGTVIGNGESTLMVPAILYPVTPDMRLYEEEQFGPVIPIAPYDSLEEVKKYAREGKYGQQVSIFTSSADVESAQLIDRFSTVFGKININTQCGRSPDTAPFSGRRSSALGVMSVMNALFEFSIPTVVSYQDVDNHAELVKSITTHSNFLQPV
jgi:glyceraldehyde-3-phosphate dehydrogenase (NADP+)